MKRILLALAALLILLPAAAILAAGTLLDSAPARARILDAVQRATGHAARIDGPIGVAWSLSPSFAVHDLALLNPPGFSRPELASAHLVEAQLALAPLLSGRIAIRSLRLDHPDILLERDAAGRGNWERPPAPEPAQPAATPSQNRAPVELDRVDIQNGTLAWRGAPPVSIPTLSVTPAGGPVSGTILINAVPLTLSGNASPAAIDLQAAAPGLTMALKGQGASLALSLDTPDLAAAEPLAGRPLPPLKSVHLTATRHPGAPIALDGQAQWRGLPLNLSAELDPSATPATIAVQATASAATLALKATVDLATRAAEATLTARAPDLQALAAQTGLTLPPLHDAALDVRLLPNPAGTALQLRGLRLTTAEGDLAGDLAVGLTSRPSLRGSLISQTLDLDAWRPPAPLPGPAPAAPPQAAPTPAAAPEPRPLIPDRPIPFAALRTADADLRLAIAQLQSHGATYRAVAAHLQLQDGRLRLDPAAFTAPGGPIQLQLLADANATPPTAALLLHAPGLDAATLNPDTTGTLDLDVDLHAAGATTSAMAATATGHLGLGLADGDVDNQLLAALFGAALRSANIPLDPIGRSRVRCIALRADLAAGQATVQTLALDAARIRLDADGTLDLAAETMDMHLRPVIRIGGTSVAVPVRLTGPIRAPRPQADKGVIAPGRFGISIGAAPPDACAPALAAIRQGLAR